MDSRNLLSIGPLPKMLRIFNLKKVGLFHNLCNFIKFQMFQKNQTTIFDILSSLLEHLSGILYILSKKKIVFNSLRKF